jgi:hypothetical protein
MREPVVISSEARSCAAKTPTSCYPERSEESAFLYFLTSLILCFGVLAGEPSLTMSRKGVLLWG